MLIAALAQTFGIVLFVTFCASCVLYWTSHVPEDTPTDTALARSIHLQIIPVKRFIFLVFMLRCFSTSRPVDTSIKLLASRPSSALDHLFITLDTYWRGTHAVGRTEAKNSMTSGGCWSRGLPISRTFSTACAVGSLFTKKGVNSKRYRNKKR